MAEFSSFIKTSIDIMATLREAAKDRHLKLEDVDFDLVGIQTLVQSDKYKDWTIIEEPLETIFDTKTINSEYLHIRQEYQIRVRPFKSSFLDKIDIAIASNKAKSKVVATFKKGTVFPCNENLAKLLKTEINRRKLRLGFLIGHFEGKLNPTLIKLAKIVQCESPLPKDIRITIAESPGAVYPTNDAIIAHYKEHNSDKKSMVQGVYPDVLIFEYIKPLKGDNGRSCSGELVVVPEPNIVYSSYAPDPESVYTKEDDKSIKYYSKIDGYVKSENYTISISKELRMKSASFRKNQSIDTDEKQDISVKIKNKNKSDDAVGSGIVMNVKELNVEGTVGANAKVRAQELNVGAQTHRNSQLEAVENATVHLHRGNLKAKTATIDILENGTVKAHSVKVGKMLGGEIIAEKVVVGEVTSNTTIIASDSIEIDLISGENNKLIINPDKFDEYHEKISNLKELIKESKKVLRELEKEQKQKESQHKDALPRIKVFKQRYIAATQAGKTPNKVDMLRIRQYKKDGEALQAHAANLKNKEHDIVAREAELEKLYESELYAYIKNNGEYNGHTQIIFVDVKTAEEYTMTPEGTYEKIYLTKDGDAKKIAC